MFNVIYCACVWWNNCLFDWSNVVCSCGHCYHSKRSLMIVSRLTLCLKAAESFLETSQCPNEHKQHGSAEKSGLRDVKRADFMRYWQRSGWKNPNKTEDFYKEKRYKLFVPPVYLMLEKIWINWGLLYNDDLEKCFNFLIITNWSRSAIHNTKLVWKSSDCPWLLTFKILNLSFIGT